MTSYRFSEPPKRHVDVAHLSADGDRRLRATNYPPEPRTEGHPVPFRNVIEVSCGRWTWVRLEPASLVGVDLGQACLRAPQDLAGLLDAHSQPYSPPLPLAAIVEEPQT